MVYVCLRDPKWTLKLLDIFLNGVFDVWTSGVYWKRPDGKLSLTDTIIDLMPLQLYMYGIFNFLPFPRRGTENTLILSAL